jgi:hypothetical protein
MVLKFLACLVLAKILACLVLAKSHHEYFACFFEKTYFCNSKSRIRFLFRLFCALIDQFILVYIHSRLSEQFSEITGGLRNNGTEQLLKAHVAIRKPEQAL